ncbi:predicted protein [Phaeodactylum tricornutum CCAP 1055/1]|uniref:Aminoglycoside phosphotransferase domain-containing protein n=1 Tax=Phaeodactylum tricornutum (strain CCAP 1055/1) TaxID=556484 RepID=B7FRU1_PHATC|nr:predicted protein [Phaeodactylum tricornutum CCAP 1055/1]EEC50674.1 predicted protein [Phaeodactylum tricornutum CCAP 1055/1]|eukprot:XP_002177860.1 predicted protein [Phaeodactylum tricornutum CCAP 1055/1]
MSAKVTDPNRQASSQVDFESLVVAAFVSLCVADSPHARLRQMHRATQNGRKVHCRALSGGKTNRCFKIYVAYEDGDDDDDSNNNLAVFGKLAFDHALWDPQHPMPYDLSRTVNEYRIMVAFQRYIPNAPVATPLACLDLTVPSGEFRDGLNTDTGVRQAKLLLIEWTQAEEPWAHQFNRGIVDQRVIPKVARALAALHNFPNINDFGRDFNQGVRPCMRLLFQACRDAMATLLSSNSKQDRCLAALRLLGPHGVERLMDRHVDSYECRNALVHHDVHLFNILVEPATPSNASCNNAETQKIKQATLTSERDEPAVVLCDWEMTFWGPMGSDPGKVMSWPLAVACCHAAADRDTELAGRLAVMTNVFWEAYANALRKNMDRDNDDCECQVFREAMGWTGSMLLTGIYVFGLYREELPLHSLSETLRVEVLASIGLLGIKLMQYGFEHMEPHLTLHQLRARYCIIIQEELKYLANNSR